MLINSSILFHVLHKDSHGVQQKKDESIENFKMTESH